MRQCKGCGATFLKGETVCLYCGTPLIPGARRQETKKSRKSEEPKREKQFAGFGAGKQRQEQPRQKAPEWDFSAFGGAFRKKQSSPVPLKMFEAWRRDHFIAAVLAFSLGTFGAHWFYLGKPGRGIWYAIFFWTGIPTLMGLVEGIGLLRDVARGE